jgi:hypothetical protein
MKIIKKCRWLGLISAGFILASSVSVIQAQTPSYIADQFDSDTTGNLQNQGWGTTVPIITWSTNNAITTAGPNNPGSGSAEFQMSWATANGDQVMVARYFDNSKQIDFNNYTNVSFDIMFPTNCGTDGAGSYGDVEFGCIPTSDGWPSTALAVYDSEVTNGNGWIHVDIPLNGSSNPKFSSVEGYYIKMQQSRTGGNLTNTTFYIDNVIYGGNQTPPPPPTMSISTNKNTAPGLMIVCGGSGGTYTRGLMMAFDVTNSTRNFSWVGSGATPVTYSQTIVSYPGTNYPIQSAIFLVQNGQFGDPGVDYDAANVAELSMYGNADGTATATFTYKTNQPDGNSQFALNTLATLTAPSPLGKWSLTFLNDTNVTLGWVPLGGGAGLSTNANFPDVTAVQTYFANPLSVFMGNQQNADANLGQSSTYSEFKISGVTASPPLDDVWSSQTTMDTTNWGKVCYAPGDILLVHPGDKYWVSWTLPDSGFGLSISTNLAAGANGWMDANLSQVVNMPTSSQALLPGLAANFPVGAKNVYFSLIKRQFTQLQVLLPGETNAPNTVSGYIGSPTPVSLSDTNYGVVTVTINACDSTWHIVSGAPGDTISVTTTDSGAVLPIPAALVNGTVQENLGFSDTGSWTVTATDTTTNAIPPATSASVTVGP